jgi:hypothetical protein
MLVNKIFIYEKNNYKYLIIVKFNKFFQKYEKTVENVEKGLRNS